MNDTEKATTGAVREAYQSAGDGLDFKRAYFARGEAFDRWMAAHDEGAFDEGFAAGRLAALEEAADRIHEVHVNGHAKDALNSREPYASYCRARSEAASSVEADIRDILRSSSPEGSN